MTDWEQAERDALERAIRADAAFFERVGRGLELGDEQRRAGSDALERWNVGAAHEWPPAIVTADHVAGALRDLAREAGWHVSEEQLLADALVIADWLHEQREEGRS